MHPCVKNMSRYKVNSAVKFKAESLVTDIGCIQMPNKNPTFQDLADFSAILIAAAERESKRSHALRAGLPPILQDPQPQLVPTGKEEELADTKRVMETLFLQEEPPSFRSGHYRSYILVAFLVKELMDLPAG